MAVEYYRDPVTGGFKPVKAPRASGYTKSETDALIESAKGIQMELLWENASKPSAFPAQKIELDLSEYSDVYVIGHSWASLNNLHVSAGVMCPKARKGVLYAPAGINGQTSGKYCGQQREFLVDNDGVLFYTGHNMNTNLEWQPDVPDSMIPDYIYGIKGVKVNG